MLNTGEAAALLRTTPGVLRKWRYQGRGPVSFRLGGRVMFTQSAIDAYLDARITSTGRGELA